MRRVVRILLIMFLILLVFPSLLPSLRVAADPGASWPTSWIQIDWDKNENGTSDDWRDVQYAYYQYDSDYLYLKLKCYDTPGKEWPDGKEGRYKWFIDFEGNMYYSGGNIFDAEYLIFVEDTDNKLPGEMYLLFETNGDNNFGEYEPWPPTNCTNYLITNPNIGGWRIVSPYQIEMYISWDSIGNPSSYWITWATDQENPNLDQGPTTDRVDEDIAIAVHDLAAVSQTPSPTSVTQGEIVTVEVVVENQGTLTETFNVTCYFDSDVIGTQLVTNLAAGKSRTLNFSWDTTCVQPGTYNIRAWADSSEVITEIDEADNWCNATATVTVTVVGYYLTVRTDPAGITTIPGQGWYQNCTHVNLTAPAFVPNEAGEAGQRYRFSHWTVDGNNMSGNPINVHMDANHTAIAHYVKQYYLTVISPYGVTGGKGWYDNYSIAYATLSTGIVDHLNGTRRVFTHWSGDASGTSLTSNPITMNAQKTATANWKTQYRLTVRTSGLGTRITNVYNGTTALGTATDAAPYTNWFDKDSPIQLDIDSPITGSPTRFVFTQWSGDATGTTRPIPVTMNSVKDITANYGTQYQVTFSQSGVGTDFTGTVVTIDGAGYGVGNLPKSFWWDKDSKHNFSFASPLVVNGGKRYVWNSTSGLSTLQSGTLTITSSGIVTGNYKTQYQITFNQIGVGSDFTGTIVTIDGTNYRVVNLSVSFWWDNCSVHSFDFKSPSLVSPNAKRYIWTSTSGLSSLQSGSIHVSTSGSIIGNYKTQYYLTVISAYDTPGGMGWYNESTTAYATLATNVVDHGNGTRRVFTQWSGDASGTGLTSNPIIMNAQKTATANWKTQYLLVVRTDPPGLSPQPTRNPLGEAGPSGSWWYDKSTSVNLTAQPVTGYTFLNWDVDGTNVTGNPITVHMNQPHTATAHYQVYVAPRKCVVDFTETPMSPIYIGTKVTFTVQILQKAFNGTHEINCTLYEWNLTDPNGVFRILRFGKQWNNFSNTMQWTFNINGNWTVTLRAFCDDITLINRGMAWSDPVSHMKKVIPRPVVGGYIAPIDKLSLLVPLIGFAVALIATVASTTLIRHKAKRSGKI